MINTIQVRVNNDLKAKSNPYVALSEQDFLDKLKESREHAVKGMYMEGNEISRNIREKYGLNNRRGENAL